MKERAHQQGQKYTSFGHSLKNVGGNIPQYIKFISMGKEVYFYWKSKEKYEIN